MNKKLISVVMAAATALSLSVSAFATSAADPSHKELDVDTQLSTPTINITWPTTAGVVLNPYKMKVKYAPGSGGKPGTVTDDTTASADDSTIISPEMQFQNKGNSEVAITVTGSVSATTTFNDKGESLGNDEEGNAITAVSKKVTFATAPIKQPSYDKTGKLVAGETKNLVLIYLEVGELDASSKKYTYSGAYDKNNANQMILSTKDTSKKLFTIPAKTGTANVKVCGDVATAPTIGWDQIAKTETVNVKLVFDASPVAPLPEKPAETTTP